MRNRRNRSGAAFNKHIRGINQISFKGSDGTQIEGQTFYVKSKIDPKRGRGERADRFFMTKAKLAMLDFTPAPGQNVVIFYNRFGKVATMTLVDDDSVIVDIG